MQQFKLIVRRRSPSNSRPPASFRRVYEGDWYEVWENTGRDEASEHLSVGALQDPAAVPHCRDIRALARARRQPGSS